jgi:hypothetical protein
MADRAEGVLLPDGSWKAAEGSSRFRDLNIFEVNELRFMAENTTPSFEGPHNATWEDQHPVAREIWARRGVGPKKEG